MSECSVVRYIEAPNYLTSKTTSVVFLAGSIEMGKAFNWQQELSLLINESSDWTVANPRRSNWGELNSPDLREQINWELDHIELADLVVFYFQGDTLSPISLAELGKQLAVPDAKNKTIVCCEPNFWRLTNVQVMCERAGVFIHSDLDSFYQAILKKVS